MADFGQNLLATLTKTNCVQTSESIKTDFEIEIVSQQKLSKMLSAFSLKPLEHFNLSRARKIERFNTEIKNRRNQRKTKSGAEEKCGF